LFLPASLLLCTGYAQRFIACRAGPTIKETAMWYFTWILGIGVALGFGIINVMWLEASGKFARDPQPAGTPPTAPEDTSS
jgi:cyd operon protein YbgT